MAERYELLFHDIVVLCFDRDIGECEVIDEGRIPFDLDLDKGQTVKAYARNINRFEGWCSGRILSLDRKYAKKILNYFGFTQSLDISDRADIALSTRCLSLNDSFWVRKAGEQVSWDEVNLFDNTLLNSVFDIALLGHSETLSNTELINPDISTDGTAPKAWKREKDGFVLLKGESEEDSVLRETEGSMILRGLGINATLYEKDTFQNYSVSRCKCFTSKDINFVRARSYKNWCDSKGKYFTQELDKFRDSFELMIIGDFLIGNADNHDRNWGFLYDNDMNIIGMNPLMDFDHAFLSSENEISPPALFTRGRISQKQYALDLISSHESDINWDIDLGSYKYGGYTKKRMEELLK